MATLVWGLSTPVSLLDCQTLRLEHPTQTYAHRGQKSIWLHNPCLIGVPKMVEINLANITLCGENEQNMCEKG